MRADMAAAYLDYRDTKELTAAVSRKDAPPPDALRGKGRSREPVWSLPSLQSFVSRQPARTVGSASREDLASLA